jgi:hypothetical protein
MAFHIDTSDRAHEEHATDVDFRVQAAAQFGFAAWSASVSTSLTYVSSTRTSSDAEINTQTDLTGEVELHFKSDYFPLSRFAPPGQVAQIQGNTAAPEANAPSAEAGGPFTAAPAVGGDVPRAPSRQRPPQPSTLRPIGAPLPEVRRPDRPAAPEPVQPPPPAPQQQPQQQTPPAEQQPPAQQTTTPPQQQTTTATPPQQTTTTTPPQQQTTPPQTTAEPQPQAGTAAAMWRR